MNREPMETMENRRPLETVELPEWGRLIAQTPEAAVQQAETAYGDAVAAVARTCLERSASVILLCGPSAGGKTTTAQRIRAELQRLGAEAVRVSLDDFYRPHDQMPRWEDGTTDYESVECLDIPCYESCMQSLLQTGTAQLPVYHFQDEASRMTRALCCTADSILIVEGLHALNPSLSAVFEGRTILRVYLSTHTNFCRQGTVCLPAKSLRLCRRMLRDIRHRHTEADETLSLWKYVRMGEERYIHPFRHTADCYINTAHAYEPFLYAEALTESLQHDTLSAENRAMADQLLAGCADLPRLGSEWIPKTSLIQEFIG